MRQIREKQDLINKKKSDRDMRQVGVDGSNIPVPFRETLTEVDEESEFLCHESHKRQMDQYVMRPSPMTKAES